LKLEKFSPNHTVLHPKRLEFGVIVVNQIIEETFQRNAHKHFFIYAVPKVDRPATQDTHPP
jgi:hypothetical protein